MDRIVSLHYLGVSSDVWSHWWRELHSFPRVYHTIHHINHMLENLLPEDGTKEMVATIWLHDIVYDPKASDNEERSAEQARRDLAGLDLNVDLVCETILGSKRHLPGSDFQNAFNDLDLLILGSSTLRYRGYANQIRAEYIHIPDEVYIPGRISVLKSFLDRDKIFLTRHYQYLEDVARINIVQEIESLQK